jgi:ELWxxDGT repeat protein
VGNTIFFMGADDTHSAELWKSDGTAAGTVMVKDINVGFSSSFPRALASINGALFFRAQSSFAAGDQPWTSDGTAAGTQQWAAIRPANASGARDFTLCGGNVYFAAQDATHGLELWAAGPTLGVAPGLGSNALSLSQSQPNPMRAQAAITYAIAVGQHVTLKMYDAQGREVRTLVDQMQSAGMHRADVDASGLASGVYFYRLHTGSEVRERKLVIQN